MTSDADARALTYRPDIDGLRAVAVGLVVLYHAFPEIRTGGFVGVDVFFVISGYLITAIVLAGLQSKRFDLAGFYRRRVRRILPALLLVMAACGLFGGLTLLPVELRWLGKSAAWCAPFLANLFFASRTGGYFEAATETNPFLHLWSLGVEEQFYLAWPILLMLTVKYEVTLRVLCAVVVTSLAISIWGAWNSPALHFYLPAPRAWELGVGGLLAAWHIDKARAVAADVPSVLPSRGRDRPADACVGAQIGARVGSMAGLALIVAGGVLWTPDRAIPGIWSVIPTAGAILLIWAGPGAPVNRWFLASRPMIWIGRISYPLYLWHWPAFSFARIFLGHAPPPVMAAGEIAAAVIAAYATYRWLELPIRHGRLGRKAVPALLAGLAGVTLLGAAADASWITGRLTGPLFTAWDDAVTDWHYPGETTIDRRSGFATLTVPSHRQLKALFIGDSHIQQYWPRVAYVIDTQPDAARSAVFASHSACLPLPGVGNWRSGQECARLFAWAIGQAYEPDVDTVVFGAFWEWYLLGAYAVKGFGQPVYSTADRTRTTLKLDSLGTQLALQDFQRIVAKLVASGRRVFIVLSSPEAPQFNPVFPASIRFSLQPPRTFPASAGSYVDVTPFESFVAPLMSRLRNIATQTGAVVVDPRLSLCDGMMCPTTGADGMPLYFDVGHIRGRTARERATFVDQMLLGAKTGLRASSSR
ncbi:MAG: acyltransferase family protein [Steroidobacteraceae bacterium]